MRDFMCGIRTRESLFMFCKNSSTSAGNFGKTNGVGHVIFIAVELPCSNALCSALSAVSSCCVLGMKLSLFSINAEEH